MPAIIDRRQWDHRSFGEGSLTHLVDASFTQRPEYVASLKATLQPLIHNEPSFHQPSFQRIVAKEIADHNPNTVELAQNVRKRVLGGQRFALLTNMGFNQFDPQIRQLYILGFTSLVGSPTVTSPRDSGILWNVKPDPIAEQKHIPTFTETDGEAEFHTDSTFRLPSPEAMFSLWSVQVDRTGNGISSLVDGTVVQDIITASTDGDEVLRVLRDTEFPFNTPAAFTRSGTDQEVVISHAPILHTEDDSPVVRWNKMGINNGAVRRGVSLTTDQEHAIKAWDQALNRRDLAYDFMIPPDAVLFVNNQELLHARSRVGDKGRHLIRVRMDPESLYTG